MYSAVYSVKTYNGSLTAIVIGSFFHFLGIKHPKHIQVGKGEYKITKKYVCKCQTRQKEENKRTLSTPFFLSLTHKVLCLRGLGDQDIL